MRFTCEDVQERWIEYIYRELLEPERSLVVSHLQHCSACQAQEKEWQELFGRFDLMASMDGTMNAPPELIYRVKRQVRFYEDWNQQQSTRLRRWITGAAAAFLMLTFGFWNTVQHDPIPRAENTLLDPIENSVLHSLYDQETLDLYRRHGMLTTTSPPSPLSMNGEGTFNPTGNLPDTVLPLSRYGEGAGGEVTNGEGI